MTGIMQMIASNKVPSPTISSVTYANMVFNLDAAGYGALPGNAISTSASLNGSSQYLSVPAGSSWVLGTGDFTIEWWQYMTTQNSNPRVFSVGTYPSASIAVSIEGGTFYVWEAGSFRFSSALSSYLNTWIHFAISRVSGNTSVYRDGTRMGSTYADVNNINNSSANLVIGNESSPSIGSYFTGYLNNFRIVKGTGVYTANFSPITFTLRPVSGTQVLLPLVATPFTDISTNEYTVTIAGNVTTIVQAPALSAYFNDLTNLYSLSRTGASISWKSNSGGYFEKNNAVGTDTIIGGPNYNSAQSYTVFVAYQVDSRSGGRLINTDSEATNDWLAGSYFNGLYYKNVFYPGTTVNLSTDQYFTNSGWNFLWATYNNTTGWGNLYIADSAFNNTIGPTTVYRSALVGTGVTRGFNRFRLWSRSGGSEVQTGNIGLLRVYDGVMPLAQIQSTWANLHTRFGI
jgi:hypothetical protein